MNQQNTNRIFPAMTAEAYFKHKEVIEAWLQGADVEILSYDDKWFDASTPEFVTYREYRVKPVNIKKYIVVGFGADGHHTRGVWSDSSVTADVADMYECMKNFDKQRTMIELEINPSNGKVVAAKVVE